MTSRVIDRPEAATGAGNRLWRAARTMALLVGGALASAMMVDVPATWSPASSHQAATQAPVPAAADWIPLGRASSAHAATAASAGSDVPADTNSRPNR